MKKAGWILIIYGLLVLFGGIMGHLKVGSTISLIMGVVFGVLLFLSGIGTLKKKLFSAYSGSILVFLLTIFFIFRTLKTFKFFPSGLMSLLSLAALIFTLIFLRKYFRRQRQK